MPGIVAGNRALLAAPLHIDQKNQYADSHQHGAAGGNQVGIAPLHFRQVGVDAASHAVEAQQMHREKCEVEAEKEQPEVHFAQALVHHATGDLGKPVINRAEQREDRPPNEHVMQVGDNKERIVDLPIERNRSQHYAGQAADQETQRRSRAPTASAFG